MFVHRVNVKQVILHQSDNMFESWQVCGEDAVHIHTAQLVRDTLWLPDYFHKQTARPDVVAKSVIDKVTMLTNGANGAGAHTLQFLVLFQQQKYFE